MITNKDILNEINLSIDDRKKAVLYNKLAINYQSKNYQKVAEYANKALNLAMFTSDKKNEYEAYNNLASNYHNQKKYKKAIIFFEKAAKVSKELRNKEMIIKNNINLSSMYLYEEMYDKARIYIKKNINLINKRKYPNFYIKNIINYAAVYFGFKNNKKAIFYYKKAIDFIHKYKFEDKDYLLLLAYQGLGIIKIQMNDIIGVEYFEKALELAKKYSKDKVIRIYKHLADYFLLKKNYQKSKTYLLTIVREESKINDDKLFLDVYFKLSNIYKKNLNFREAFYYFEKAYILEKNIQQEKENKKLENYEEKFKEEVLDKDIEIYKLKTKQLKKLNSELEIANKQIKEATEAKTVFLTNMSHEIRTPMNAIVGFTDLLIGKESDLEKKDILLIIKESSNILLNLINNMLDISKIEAGKTELVYSNLNIKKIIERIVKILQYKTSKKNVIFEINIPEIDYELFGDEMKVKQIFINILGNAIKFTDKGKISIDADIIGIDKQYLQIQFKIKDTGKGIDNDKLSAIFEPFTQEDSSISRRHGGTGLGLTITKKLIGLMNGEIEVYSKPQSLNEKDHGTSFIFDIHLKIGNKILKSNIKLKDDYKKDISKVLNILIVEDNKINQKLMDKILTDMNHNITIADDGCMAISILENKKFDLILMDIQMPNMDGIEATKKIRDLDIKTPILALTAHAMEEDRIQCLEAGMNDYIIKPVTKDNLIDKFKNWAYY